jgi:hypothetical protein
MKSINCLIFLISFTISCFGQDFVSIPDTNFLKALILNNVDENNNGKIEIIEAQKTTLLDLEKRLIKDLSGLEYFSSLNELNCRSNQIKALDLSKNVALEYLYSDGNELNIIDVSKNILLQHFHCANNHISKIDISKNENLVHLDCHNNPVDSLDFSNNKQLRKLEAYNNLIRNLDLTFNPDLYNVVINKNPFLKQICIKNAQYNQTISSPQNWVKDNSANWNTNCITGLEDELYLISSKKVERIYNSLGQEMKLEDIKNGLFIYQYSDGSTKKIMLTE